MSARPIGAGEKGLVAKTRLYLWRRIRRLFSRELWLRSIQSQRDLLEGQIARREMIKALYKDLLGRDADPFGLATYDELLRNVGSLEGIRRIITSLVSSNEFDERVANTPERILRILGPPGQRQVNGRKVAHIISLGTHCLTSYYMKRFGLKPYSLPFDWLFTSPETILHCLEDDFAELLDPRHFIPIEGPRENPEPGAEHRLYRDLHRVHNMFAHRDPTNEADLRYFNRTVDRFRRIIAGDDGKLFVMIVRPIYDASKTFLPLSAKITSITENSAFICIQLRPPTNRLGCQQMRAIQVNGDHTLYEFRPSSKELGLGFKEPLDDLVIMRLVREFDTHLAPDVSAGG